MFYSDQIISNLASNFGTFIISWLVYQITGSSTAMGGLWLVTLLAQMVTQFFIGPYLDSIPRKKVMMYSEFIRLTSFLIIMLLLINNGLIVGELYGCAVLNSIVMYDPAANALLPAIVSKEQLTKANSRVISSIQLVRFLAYPIVGFCIGFLSAKISIIITVFMFVCSMFIIQSISEDMVLGVKATWLTQFRNGIAIYKQMPILLVLGLFIAVTNFGVIATQTMYIPFVRNVLSGSSFQYGLFAGCFPLGYIFGSTLVGSLKDKSHNLYFMFGALLYGGLTFVLLSLTKNFYTALLIEISSGVIMPFWGVNSTTLYQRVVPSEIRAQVFAVRSLIAKSATPVGALYATFAVSHFSIPFLFLSVGVFSCLIACFGLILGRIKFSSVSLQSYNQRLEENVS